MLFQSTPSAWRETVFANDIPIIYKFQSTPSAWRETHIAADLVTVYLHIISIHSLRMEGDGKSIGFNRKINDFNPLPPHGGRPLFSKHFTNVHNFNPLPPHGGRLYLAIFHIVPVTISIHSLRMEGDNPAAGKRGGTAYFNPLPPHGGRPGSRILNLRRFLYFNPLPPHGGRPDRQYRISNTVSFQSTPSAWRETP